MINLNKYRVFSVAAVTSFAAFLFTTDAHSTTQDFTCPKLLKVMIMTGSGTTSDPARFIAQCSTASGNGISYFAYRLSDGADMFRALVSVANAAQLSGRPLEIYFDYADTSAGAWGCGLGNCRPVQQFRLN
jgi:hypothetical protein